VSSLAPNFLAGPIAIRTGGDDFLQLLRCGRKSDAADDGRALVEP
jgi:hypothetical protein